VDYGGSKRFFKSRFSLNYQPNILLI
jgi:hypothetical protein